MSQEILTQITSKDNKAFCVMPWVSINGEINGDFCLCCYDSDEKDRGTIGNIKNMNHLGEYWNGDALNKIRKSLIEGKKISRCRNCYKREQLGVESMREKMNGLYKYTINEIPKQTNTETGETTLLPTYLDIRFSNVCNLSCRMCWSGYSSSRIELDKRINSGKYIATEVGVWNTGKIMESDMLLSNLVSVYIAGGEPFLSYEQKEFVDLLVEKGSSKNIDIVYNTNITYVREEFLTPLLHFKNVNIIISCDGYREVYEYIRIGAKWKDFLKNFLFIKKFFSIHNFPVDITMNTVVQMDNVVDLPKMYVYVRKHMGIQNIKLEILVGPDYLSIENVEMYKRPRILQIYNTYIEKYKDTMPEIEKDLAAIITILKESTPNTDQLRRYYETKEIMDDYTKEKLIKS